MGRKKLNRTKEYLAEQNRSKVKRFYEKNRESICAERMRRYWETKKKPMDFVNSKPTS